MSNILGNTISKKKSFRRIRKSFQKVKKDSSSDLFSSEWYIDSDVRKLEHFDRVSRLCSLEHSMMNIERALLLVYMLRWFKGRIKPNGLLGFCCVGITNLYQKREYGGYDYPEI